MFAVSAVVLLRAAACLVVVQTAAVNTTHKEPFGLVESISTDYDAKQGPSEWETASVEEDSVSDELLGEGTNSLISQEVYDEFKNIIVEKPSEDSSFVLIGYDKTTDIQSVAKARYAVYSVKDKKIIHICESELLQFISWGSQNRLVYVHDNDIYYLSEPGAEPVAVTTDGEPMVIYNGVLLNYGDMPEDAANTVGKGGTVLWSQDYRSIVFERYNASAVRQTDFVNYGAAERGKDMYTRSKNFLYAKPGTPIPDARLMVAILPSEESPEVTIRELLPPVDVVGEDRFIGYLERVDINTVVAQWTNRFLNVSQIVTYNTSEEVQLISGEKGLKLERKDGWVKFKQLWFGYRNPSTYLMIDWEPQKEAGSFPHVVKVTGTCRTPITSGEFTVTEIYGFDSNYVVYFQATEEGHPSHRHVYAVTEGRSPRCLSCGVTSPEGNLCTAASAEFFVDFIWMILTCHGPDPLFKSFHYTANVTGKSITLQDNSELREKLSHKQLPRRLDDWVDLGDGMRAQVRMWLPPGLDPEGSEKRPAIVKVYGAPDTQRVVDSFSVGIHSYFTTSRRYVYILIDGRGSGCKGDRMLYSVYRKLGTVEIQDQINVTKRLAEKYRFIDSSRIAVWGWSYGGYAAAMALARDEEKVFRCGVAVAPITDWRIDSAIYVERYMGLPTPEDNEDGYIDSAVTELADRFSNNTFLLIHGTADQNVLLQNSMMLAYALEKSGVLFRQQVYPDEGHSIQSFRTHVYTTIDAFFCECFNEESPSLQTT